MFWFHEFCFVSVAYLIWRALKRGILKLERFCIGSLLMYTFLIPNHPDGFLIVKDTCINKQSQHPTMLSEG